ncbi:hypothetical protein D3C71_1593030 [compost metagenome]
MQRGLGRGYGRLGQFGEQQQRRDAQVFHDFHVVALTVLGLFERFLDLRNGHQVLQHFLGLIGQVLTASVQAETGHEALAPLAQRGGAVAQCSIIGRQQQDDRHVVAGQLALDHFLQADQGIADTVTRLDFQQLGGIGQPGIGIEAGAGAAAANQQAVQFGRGDRMAIAREQHGESVVGRLSIGHGQLGARRRNV